MNKRGLTGLQRIPLVLIVVFMSISGLTYAQTTFIDDLFRVLDDVVNSVNRNDITEGEMSALRDQLAQLESELAANYQHQQLPAANYDALRYLIMTAQQLTNHIPGQQFQLEERQAVASLKQAIWDYHNPAPQAEIPESPAVIPASERQQPAPLEFKIGYLYRPMGGQAFQPLLNNGSMHSGDLYKVAFIPSVDCYVYIFQADASGAIYGLFPIEQFRGVKLDFVNAEVRKGEKYVIPGPDKSFQLDQTIGTERIYFLVSQERDLELEELSQQVTDAQNDENSGQLKAAQIALTKNIRSKGVFAVVPDAGTIRLPEEQEPHRGGETILIDTQEHSLVELQQRLSGKLDKCVQVLTFQHR